MPVAVICGVFAGYQNCGSGNSLANQMGLGSGQVNSQLYAQVIPTEMTLDDISYMSCPQAGASTASNGDPIGAPFYRLRFGSFDNSANNGFTGFAGTYAGGIGFSQAAMSYARGAYGGSPSASQLTTYLNTSPYSSGAQPVVAVINQFRSPSSLSWTALATPVLQPFSNASFAASLTSAFQIPSGGTVKTGFFPGMAAGTNSLVGTLTWGQSESDELNFRTNMINEYLFAGFAPASSADATTITQTLASPDQNVTERLFGYGYSMSFQSNDSYIVANGINEWSLDPSSGINPVNMTSTNNEQWDCFALTVVRDVDRKYWTVDIVNDGSTTTMSVQSALKGTTVNMGNSAVLYPKDVPAALSQYGLANLSSATQFGLQVNYFANTTDIANVMNYLATEFTSGVQANLLMGYGSDGGTYYPCPPEDPTTMTETTLERLRIVRRFLSADNFEVNISAGCVVPTQTAENAGTCYASGDTNQANFIQYDGINGTSCGTGMNECPSRVSFCWRYQ